MVAELAAHPVATGGGGGVVEAATGVVGAADGAADGAVDGAPLGAATGGADEGVELGMSEHPPRSSATPIVTVARSAVGASRCDMPSN
jgi:hypothetical protein